MRKTEQGVIGRKRKKDAVKRVRNLKRSRILRKRDRISGTNNESKNVSNTRIIAKHDEASSRAGFSQKLLNEE